MNRVFVLSTAPKLSHYVQSRLPQLKVIDIHPDDKEALASLETAEILIADVWMIPKYSDQLKRAKWIQATSAGVDKLLKTLSDKKPEFVITRYADNAFGLDMTEYVIAHIVNHERNQWNEYECQKKAIWSKDTVFKERRLISEMTIGILGLGNIGKCAARILKSFGAKIWGLTRTQPQGEILEIVDEHRTVENLPDLLKNCDYVICMMPATPETNGLLNGNMLENCKEKGSVLMSVGRGNIIKEDDLVNALEKKWISAAILDVFEVEPLPQTSKLWHMPQVIITPHNACNAKPKGIAALFESNYKKFIEGKPLPNIVDFERGY